MSRIFRSDAVQAGERVVLRRIIDGKHSDIIGHVIAHNETETTIRPQLTGGFLPSKTPSLCQLTR